MDLAQWAFVFIYDCNQMFQFESDKRDFSVESIQENLKKKTFRDDDVEVSFVSRIPIEPIPLCIKIISKLKNKQLIKTESCQYFHDSRSCKIISSHTQHIQIEKKNEAINTKFVEWKCWYQKWMKI